MTPLTVLQIACYGAAAAIFSTFLVHGRTSAARWGRLVLAAGVALQFADIGVHCVRLQNPFSSISEAMAFVAWMIAGGYFLAGFRYRIAAAGAFAVPAALILLVLARVVPADTGGPRIGTLGLVHIFLATAGEAIFTLAAVLSGLYLVEERQLKRKRFGLLGRGTPLDTLDRLAGLCISFGFPVFTVALVTGAVWVARLGVLHGREALRPEYLLAVATWIAFGVLLVARTGGWHGRRAAWATLGGFGGALLVLVVYLIRHAA